MCRIGHQRLAIRGSAIAAGRCASSSVGPLAPAPARSGAPKAVFAPRDRIFCIPGALRPFSAPGKGAAGHAIGLICARSAEIFVARGKSGIRGPWQEEIRRSSRRMTRRTAGAGRIKEKTAAVYSAGAYMFGPGIRSAATQGVWGERPPISRRLYATRAPARELL